VPGCTIQSVPLQRSSLCELDVRGHPRRRSPREVRVPFRVLTINELVTRRASSPTALPFAHAGARLRGTFSLIWPCGATRTTILSWGSLLLQGLYPLDPPRTSRCAAPLLGLVPLQCIRGAESTLLLPGGPIRPTTFRPQALTASRRLAPPPTFRAFRRGNTRGVLPTGSSPPEQARQLVAAGFPSWRSSLGLRTLVLVTREPGAQGRPS